MGCGASTAKQSGSVVISVESKDKVESDAADTTPAIPQKQSKQPEIDQSLRVGEVDPDGTGSNMPTARGSVIGMQRQRRGSYISVNEASDILDECLALIDETVGLELSRDILDQRLQTVAQKIQKAKLVASSTVRAHEIKKRLSSILSQGGEGSHTEGAAVRRILQDYFGAEENPSPRRGSLKNFVKMIMFTRRLKRQTDASRSDVRNVAKKLDSLTPMPHPAAEALASVLSKVYKWDFDIFEFHKLTDGAPLSLLFKYLVNDLGLNSIFQISPDALDAFSMALEASHNNVPYHNSTHAADVLQNTCWLVHSTVLARFLQPLDLLAALTAAASHDLMHPGTNNTFQVATQTELALRYNDKSVLENASVSALFLLLKQPRFNILSRLTRQQHKDFRDAVIAMILATDMALHFNVLAELQTLSESKLPEPGEAVAKELRLVVLKSALHCSDLGNPCKPLNTYLKWSERIVEEFFMQGDAEKEAKLPISPSMDRNHPTIERSQIVFIEVIVGPLFRAARELVADVEVCLEHMDTNHAYWVQAEEAAGPRDGRASSSATRPRPSQLILPLGTGRSASASPGPASPKQRFSGSGDSAAMPSRGSSSQQRSSSSRIQPLPALVVPAQQPQPVSTSSSSASLSLSAAAPMTSAQAAPIASPPAVETPAARRALITGAEAPVLGALPSFRVLQQGGGGGGHGPSVGPASPQGRIKR